MSPPTQPAPVSSPPCAVPQDPAEWFKQQVHPHDGQLKSYLRSQFPTVRDVEDVVQESYLRIWKARATTRFSSAKNFLFQIARNLAVDFVRREKVSPIDSRCKVDLSFVLDHSPDAATQLLNEDLLRHVLDALVDLPPRYRDPLVLHKLEALSHREVAARLNLNERLAQKYCSIGIARCGEFLKRRGIANFFG